MPANRVQRRARSGGPSSVVIILIAALVLGGVATAFILSSGGPESVEDYAVLFRNAWNGEGDIELSSFIEESRRERLSNQFATLLEKRDWTEERPPLGQHRVGASREDAAHVFHPLVGGELRVSWIKKDDRWRVVGLHLPDYDPETDPPSAEAVAAVESLRDRFLDGWNRDDRVQLASLWHERNRESRAKKLARKLDEDWKGIGLSAPSTEWWSRGRARVSYLMDNGKRLRCSFTIESGKWGLAALSQSRS